MKPAQFPLTLVYVATCDYCKAQYPVHTNNPNVAEIELMHRGWRAYKMSDGTITVCSACRQTRTEHVSFDEQIEYLEKPKK